MKKLAAVWLILAIVAVSLGAWAAEVTTVMVPMADGTALATDYYLPDGEGPWPVVLARSTYGRGMTGDADRFTGQGIAFVIQDVRGMGQSEGEKHVFYAEGWREGMQDGKDTVEWVKAQPWCNGKIATFGSSALAITQMLLAPSTQDVAAQYMDMVPSSMYHNMVYQGGVFRKSLVEGWLGVIGQPHVADLWKAHPSYDEFWQHGNAEAQAAKITAAGLHVGGWWDIFQQGTINGFVTRQEQGGKGARGTQRLIMKPTPHGPFAPEMKYTMSDKWDDLRVSQHRQAFLNKYLLDADADLGPAVHYFTVGSDEPGAPGNEWRTADTWPPFETIATPMYLDADGKLAGEAPANAASAGYDYDPNDPFPTHGGANLLLPAGPLDQSEKNKDRSDWLAFATGPLEAPIEVTGQVRVKLYVSTDAPDTDFTAKLVDITPDGRELLLLDSIQRVKFRNGFEKAAPLLASADEVVEVEIDLWSISWVFNTGHRIGLQISSSNYPRFEKNPNTGEDFPGETLRVAHNVVHFGGDYPSAIILPVHDPESDDDGDGLTLAEEFAAGTSPTQADTDGDGVNNGAAADAATGQEEAPAAE